MGPVSASASIDAPREEVFEFLRDLANRPAICDHFMHDLRLERIESEGVGAAARYRVGDRGPWMETVIEEIDAPHRISEAGRTGRLNRVPAATVWELVEGPGRTSCEVTVTFWTSPSHPLDRLADPGGSPRRARRHWRRALARLRDAMENPGPRSRVGVGGGDRMGVA